MSKVAVIITGTRGRLNEKSAAMVCDDLAEALIGGGDLFVGDASGVDAIAREVAKEYDARIHPDRFGFRADWHRLGKRAGPVRNETMVNAFQVFMKEHRDYVYRAFAFPGPSSVGTWGCLRLMVGAGLYVRVMGVTEQ